MNGLAGLYLLTNNEDNAEQMYTKCLEKRKIKLGNNHPDTVITKNNFVLFYAFRGSKYNTSEKAILACNIFKD
jgi:hypothetical protein